MTVTMYVTYAGDSATPFDRDHWIRVHMPLDRECWGPYGLVSASGFFPADDGGGPIAIRPCVFRDHAAMQAALAAPETKRAMDDVRTVTSVEPERSLASSM